MWILEESLNVMLSCLLPGKINYLDIIVCFQKFVLEILNKARFFYYCF